VPLGGVAWPDQFAPQQARVPSVLTPQLWASPAETEVKVPLATVDPPDELPQQSTQPSLRTPQAFSSPAEMAMNVPLGGVAWPALLRPQHARAPSVRMAQPKPKPHETAVKLPAGGVVSPCQSSPQQTMDPSGRMPQTKFQPPETETNVPLGPSPPYPQQATVPSVRIPHFRPRAVIAVKVPVGGTKVSPQQASVPSDLSAHAEVMPTSMARVVFSQKSPQVPGGQSQAKLPLPRSTGKPPCSHAMPASPLPALELVVAPPLPLEPPVPPLCPPRVVVPLPPLPEASPSRDRSVLPQPASRTTRTIPKQRMAEESWAIPPMRAKPPPVSPSV